MKKYLLFILFVNVVNIYSQNDFQNNLEGVWKLKSIENANTSINFTEYIKFANNKIHFFRVESGNEKLLDIKKFEIKNNYTGSQQIKFENGEVWTLRLRSINNETRLIWKNEVDKDCSMIINVDDRGHLKDKEARKKALEKEIYTYYVKIK